MKNNLPLPHKNKLLVIYRLELDCFGLVGHKQINKFCAHLTKNVIPIDSGFIKWTVIPRLNSEEKEIEFRVDGKLLKHDQSIRYLAVFNREYDTFVESLNESIMDQIDHYFANQ